MEVDGGGGETGWRTDILGITNYWCPDFTAVKGIYTLHKTFEVLKVCEKK